MILGTGDERIVLLIESPLPTRGEMNDQICLVPCNRLFPLHPIRPSCPEKDSGGGQRGTGASGRSPKLPSQKRKCCVGTVRTWVQNVGSLLIAVKEVALVGGLFQTRNFRCYFFVMPKKVAPLGPTKTPVVIQFEYDVWQTVELAFLLRHIFA